MVDPRHTRQLRRKRTWTGRLARPRKRRGRLDRADWKTEGLGCFRSSIRRQLHHRWVRALHRLPREWKVQGEVVLSPIWEGRRDRLRVVWISEPTSNFRDREVLPTLWLQVSFQPRGCWTRGRRPCWFQPDDWNKKMMVSYLFSMKLLVKCFNLHLQNIQIHSININMITSLHSKIDFNIW